MIGVITNNDVKEAVCVCTIVCVCVCMCVYVCVYAIHMPILSEQQFKTYWQELYNILPV